ncbi:hypothetical protein N0V88_004860 [Collariella sp. IMI 366227]|nr:hypothetical protein N0V88_004860 [Collariella sp. IMI 366227]
MSEQRRQPSTEGLYQIVISEVLINGGVYPLERGGGRAFAVSSVLDLGLRMLESHRGRNALENVARKAISNWRERSGRGPVSEFEHINLPAAVDEFLHSVRFCFPIVKLDDREGFCHEEDGKTPRSNPRVSAILHLNWQLMDQLYRARLKAAATQHDDERQTGPLLRFRRLHFHLAATVAHHFCHLFTNFLRGYDTLANEVSDADFLRLVGRYDPGKEFEKEFFGTFRKSARSSSNRSECRVTFKEQSIGC